MVDFPSYFTRCLVCISQTTNVVIFNGYPDEMLSSRCYRSDWQCLQFILDSILGKDHCKECYEWEKNRIDSPRFDEI
jgi:hypothetical protein